MDNSRTVYTPTKRNCSQVFDTNLSILNESTQIACKRYFELWALITKHVITCRSQLTADINLALQLMSRLPNNYSQLSYVWHAACRSVGCTVENCVCINFLEHRWKLKLFLTQLQSIRSRTTTTTSLASSEYVPMPDILLAGQELEDCWEDPEEDKGEESWNKERLLLWKEKADDAVKTDVPVVCFNKHCLICAETLNSFCVRLHVVSLIQSNPLAVWRDNYRVSVIWNISSFPR